MLSGQIIDFPEIAGDFSYKTPIWGRKSVVFSVAIISFDQMLNVILWGVLAGPEVSIPFFVKRIDHGSKRIVSQKWS